MKQLTYLGISAYHEVMSARNGVENSVIRQIINGEMVKKLHEETGILKQAINSRVEKNNSLRNLISYEDRNNKTEISDPKMLKETRYLPKGVQITAMFASFGETLTELNLDIENLAGTITTDKNITDTFNTMFDLLWEQSEAV